MNANYSEGHRVSIILMYTNYLIMIYICVYVYTIVSNQIKSYIYSLECN